MTHLDGGDIPLTPNALVPVQRRLTGWDERGQPVVYSAPMLTKSQIADIVTAAVSQPYEEEGDALAIEMGLPPSKFYGRTNIEVMLIRLAEHAARTGDKDEVEDFLDRLLGKPKQTSEVVKTTLTYEDRLKEIAARRAAAAKSTVPTSPQIVEAEVIEDIFG